MSRTPFNRLFDIAAATLQEALALGKKQIAHGYGETFTYTLFLEKEVLP